MTKFSTQIFQFAVILLAFFVSGAAAAEKVWLLPLDDSCGSIMELPPDFSSALAALSAASTEAQIAYRECKVRAAINVQADLTRSTIFPSSELQLLKEALEKGIIECPKKHLWWPGDCLALALRERDCKARLRHDDPAFAVCEAIVGEKASRQGCRNRKSNELAIRFVAKGKPAPCRILGEDEINQFLATTKETAAFEFAGKWAPWTWSDNLSPLFDRRAVCDVEVSATICQADVHILAQAGLPLLTDDEISMCRRSSPFDFSECINREDKRREDCLLSEGDPSERSWCVENIAMIALCHALPNITDRATCGVLRDTWSKQSAELRKTIDQHKSTKE